METCIDHWGYILQALVILLSGTECAPDAPFDTPPNLQAAPSLPFLSVGFVNFFLHIPRYFIKVREVAKSFSTLAHTQHRLSNASMRDVFHKISRRGKISKHSNFRSPLLLLSQIYTKPKVQKFVLRNKISYVIFVKIFLGGEVFRV